MSKSNESLEGPIRCRIGCWPRNFTNYLQSLYPIKAGLWLDSLQFSLQILPGQTELLPKPSTPNMSWSIQDITNSQSAGGGQRSSFKSKAKKVFLQYAMSVKADKRGNARNPL